MACLHECQKAIMHGCDVAKHGHVQPCYVKIGALVFVEHSNSTLVYGIFLQNC